VAGDSHLDHGFWAAVCSRAMHKQTKTAGCLPCNVRRKRTQPHNLEQSFITSGGQVKCSGTQRPPNLREILTTAKCPGCLTFFVPQVLGAMFADRNGVKTVSASKMPRKHLSKQDFYL